MQKIILDTDPGIDDAQAIAFAIAHPDIELLGLTTVFGNANIEITTRNALTVLEQFSRPEIPVAQGAGMPLAQDRFPSPDFVHGSDGMGNLNLPSPETQVIDENAVDFIIRQANDAPGEISLVAVGPLTNIAQAVKADPSLPSKVRELIIMGGTLNETGNVTPVSEANFINDPHAADMILAHQWPTTIIGLDVTLQTRLGDPDLFKIKDNCASAGQFLWDSSRFYLDFYSSRFASSGIQERSCAMHDASALIYLVARDKFELVTGAARVVADGIAQGQLTLDIKKRPYLLPYWESRPDTKVAIDVDAQHVLNTFVDTLTAHDFT